MMILVLDIEDKNKASWLLIKDKKIKDFLKFKIDRENDKTFISLDKLLLKNKINMTDLSILALTVKDAGLTQVKVFTAIINTFAWQLGISVIGKYYYKSSLEEVLSEILVDIKNRKSNILKIEYKQNPDISVSKKVPKYVIKK